MPADAGSGKTVHALGPIDAANNSFASAGAGHASNAVRITAPLGEVTLNFVKATDGSSRPKANFAALAKGVDESDSNWKVSVSPLEESSELETGRRKGLG